MVEALVVLVTLEDAGRGSWKLVCWMEGSNSESSVIRSSTFFGGVWTLGPREGLGEGHVGKEAGLRFRWVEE